jgi:hypothetical protein
METFGDLNDEDNQKKRRISRDIDEGSTDRYNVSFSGQGNQNIGSGGISIGGSQKFR